MANPYRILSTQRLRLAISTLLCRAPTGRAATVSHTPTGLHDYERRLGSQHSHIMDADDGYGGRIFCLSAAGDARGAGGYGKR